MINITLPDGSQRAFDAAVSVADVAASIGPGLAKAALAGKVDGKLVDTSFTYRAATPRSRSSPKSTPMRSKSCATPPRICWRRPCSACSPARRSRSAR